MFKYYTYKLNLVKKFTNLLVVTFFFFSINLSFSQLINQGELLNEKTFESAISINRKSGADLYANLYSNYTINLDINQVKVDAQTILKSAKSILGVLECQYDSTTGVLIVLTRKIKSNPFEDQIKQNIDLLGYVQLSITELIYKN